MHIINTDDYFPSKYVMSDNTFTHSILLFIVTASCKKRLMSSYNLEKVAPIMWGITHEETAKTIYKKQGGIIKETGKPCCIKP